MSGRATILCALAVLTGCASSDRQGAFDDTAALLSDRIEASLQWSDDDDAAREIRRSIEPLLQGQLTADAAVQIALLNNRSLQSTFEALGVASADLVQAGLLKNPVFDGSVKFAEGGGGDMWELSVSQSFLDVVYMPMRKAVARARLERAKRFVAARVLDLAAETRAAYYGCVAEAQRVEMLEAVAAAMHASWRAAEKLRSAGNIRELDVTNERLSYEQARHDLSRAHARVLQLRERLNALMGLWGADTAWTAPTGLPAPPDEDLPLERLETRAVERSLALAVARTRIEEAGQRLGLVRLETALPEGALGPAAELEPSNDWLVGVGLSLAIPIFDLGQAAAARGRAELRRAYHDFFAVAVQTRAHARAARTQYVSARDRARHYRDTLLPLRTHVLEATQQQYNAMQLGVFELLQAKRAQIDAGRRYIDLLQDYWVARSTLESIASGRIPEGGFGIEIDIGAANEVASPMQEGGHE